MSFNNGRKEALIEVEEKITQAKEDGKAEGIIEGVKEIKNEMYNHLIMYGVVAMDFPLPLEEGEEESKVLRVFLVPRIHE